MFEHLLATVTIWSAIPVPLWLIHTLEVFPFPKFKMSFDIPESGFADTVTKKPFDAALCSLFEMAVENKLPDKYHQNCICSSY